MYRLLIDVSQVAHAVNYIQNKHGGNNLNEAVHTYIENVLLALSMQGVKGKPILLYDSRPTFRTKIYEDYKGHRDKSYIKWQPLYEYLGKHYQYINHPELEADDLAYIICALRDEEIILVSSDRDWGQVVDLNDNVMQFCPREKKFIDYSAEASWEVKIILGDNSDNIPKVLPNSIQSIKKGQVVEKSLRVGAKGIQRLMEQGLTVPQILAKYNVDINAPDVIRNYELIVYSNTTYLKYVENFDNFIDLLISTKHLW